MSSTLAVIFDFDDTLLPDSTTKLLEEHNIHSRRFWSKDVKALVSSGYDPTLAWMKLFLDNVGQGKPLGQLTNAGLRSFGSTLENSLYPGLGTFFRDLRRIVAKYPDIDLEFYIISGGLQPVIESCKLIQENFHFVYGSQLAEEQQTGAVRHIKRCVTFTEKTRYLFEINKGLDPKRTLRNPYLVNKDVPPR